jgi:hypothetical protein
VTLNNESRVINERAVQALDALALACESMLALCVRMDSTGSRDVRHRLNLRKYRNYEHFTAECYVEVDLPPITWWLEVGWSGDRWTIDCEVLVQDNEGQHSIREFQRTAVDIDDFERRLGEATRELVATVDDSGISAALAKPTATQGSSWWHKLRR